MPDYPAPECVPELRHDVFDDRGQLVALPPLLVEEVEILARDSYLLGFKRLKSLKTIEVLTLGNATCEGM